MTELLIVIVIGRDNGTFDADGLAQALANLDASQIDNEMRGAFVG